MPDINEGLKMKRIAIISDSAFSLLTFRKDFIKYLKKEGYEVFGFAIDFTDETEEALKSLGATPVSYSLDRGGLNPIKDLIGLKKLAKIVREINPDIVFSTFVKPVIFGTLAARMVKVKRVVGMLEGLGFCFTEQPEGFSLKARFIKKIQIFLFKIAFPKLDLLIFLNYDDPKDLLESYSIKTKKYEVLGGIGLSLVDFQFSKPEKRPVSFLFVGRLLKEKGIFEFLEAAEKVKKIYQEVEFMVLGDVDTENPGSIKLDKLNTYIDNKIIQYNGYVSDVTPWLQKSDVFVLPSYREGIPRTTQEAMASGRAVITTDVPGCRETVINGYNGFLIPKWNVDALVEKMLFFIVHPDEIDRMGINARAFAEEHYDADKINKKLLQIIIGS